ncbi:MAG: GtrA family protein [Tabrizicola sp.]|nr:GtrA family protein [Tabrizicola sp.]
MVGRLVRFGGVGIVATLVHTLVALALERWASLPPQGANLIGFLAAVQVSYFGHARFTFGVDPRSADQFLRFFIVALTGLAASSGIVWLVTLQLGYDFALAMLLVACIVPVVTFAAAQLWVFREATNPAGATWLGLAMALAVPLGLVILSWNRALTDDVAWYVIATRDWLAGAELYRDIIEVNPPLNFYYTVPAILVADGLGLTDTNAQYVVTAALVLGSLLWCRAIIRADLSLSPHRQALLVLGVGAAMVIPALDSIGQREQTLVILMMPWLIGQLSPVPARPRSELARALVAAFGMCVKPHFVLFPIAITLLHMAQRRSLAPILSVSNLTFLAVGLAYVGYVALVHPARPIPRSSCCFCPACWRCATRRTAKDPALSWPPRLPVWRAIFCRARALPITSSR